MEDVKALIAKAISLIEEERPTYYNERILSRLEDALSLIKSQEEYRLKGNKVYLNKVEFIFFDEYATHEQLVRAALGTKFTSPGEYTVVVHTKERGGFTVKNGERVGITDGMEVDIYFTGGA